MLNLDNFDQILLRKIFLELPDDDLGAIQLTCRNFKRCIDNNFFKQKIEAILHHPLHASSGMKQWYLYLKDTINLLDSAPLITEKNCFLFDSDPIYVVWVDNQRIHVKHTLLLSEETIPYPPSDPLMAIKLVDEGAMNYFIYTVSSAGQLYKINLTSKERTKIAQLPKNIVTFQATFSNNWLVLQTKKGLQIYHLKNFYHPFVIAHHPTIAFTLHESILAFVSEDLLYVWDLQNASSPVAKHPYATTLNSIVLSQNQLLCIEATSIQIRDLTGQLLSVLQIPEITRLYAVRAISSYFFITATLNGKYSMTIFDPESSGCTSWEETAPLNAVSSTSNSLSTLDGQGRFFYYKLSCQILNSSA